MTPLLPHPSPWPSGEALLWARDLHWGSLPALGSVAIQLVAHQVDEDALPPRAARWLPRAGIPDLLVRCQGSKQRPSWHALNGLYGFSGLPPGPHTFTIVDPLGRYLPTSLVLSVPDRAAAAASLAQLERPSEAENWRQWIHRHALRPSAAAQPRQGATWLRGEVRDASGHPVPLAWLQVRTRFHGVPATATTWSDPAGGYALDLDGLRQDPLATPAEGEPLAMRLFLPQPPDPLAPPWREPLPKLDAVLVAQLASDLAPLGYSAPLSSAPPGSAQPSFHYRDGPSGSPVADGRLPIGRLQRWDLVVNGP